MKSPILKLLGLHALLLSAIGSAQAASEFLKESTATVTSRLHHSRERYKLIIDTDSDYDDVLALIYAAKSPAVELVLVTACNTGFAYPSDATYFAQASLAKGAAHRGLVANGSWTSDGIVATFPPQWRALTHTFFQGLFGPAPPTQARSAFEALREALRREASGASGGQIGQAEGASGASASPGVALSGSVDYVALGPLTNLAAALRDAELRQLFRRHVRRVVVSGGAFELRGNVEVLGSALRPDFVERGGRVNAAAECNLFIDAEAADFALREARFLGLQVVFFPTDATESLTVAPEQARGGSLVAEVLRGFARAMPEGVRPSYWDAGAVVGAVAPERLCRRWQRLEGVAVETRVGPGYDYGRVLGRRTPAAGPTGLGTVACLESNYSAFLEEFWSVSSPVDRGLQTVFK